MDDINTSSNVVTNNVTGYSQAATGSAGVVPELSTIPASLPPIATATSDTSPGLPAPSHNASLSSSLTPDDNGSDMDVDNDERVVSATDGESGLVSATGESRLVSATGESRLVSATGESRHSSLDATANATMNMVGVTPGIECAPHSVLNLDSLVSSTLPGWLRGPAKYLVKNFRGETEDELLVGLFSLEMAWNPVSSLIAFFHSFLIDVNTSLI